MTTLSKKATEEVLGNYSQTYLNCRSLGHQWEHTHVDIVYGHRKKIIEYLEHILCLCCKARKVRVLSPDGQITRSYMVYPSNYLIHRTDVNLRHNKHLVRMELLRRVQHLQRGDVAS